MSSWKSSPRAAEPALALRVRWRKLQQLRPQLETMQARLPEHEKRLRRTIKHAVHDMDQRFRGLVGRLDALSPLAVIARGYSVLTTEEGGLIRDSEQVQPGNSINARLHEGRITATVTATSGGRVQEASDIYRAAPPQTD